MSRLVLQQILSEIGVWLSSIDFEQLYRELTAYFGLAGALDECRALEEAWRDPYTRRSVEEFVKAWVRRKRSVVAIKA
ncbi:MAG: hypothetical protein N3H31_02615 [Candidatus Nezhaarchaeota archaeon]|nr:hypothetical protein [Candidatus Nezhaarchaeota archaeon]